MKLDRIYTRSGDDGRTSLGDGARLPKFHVRVAAYGSVDEANSVIGIALLHVEDADLRVVHRLKRQGGKHGGFRRREQGFVWLHGIPINPSPYEEHITWDRKARADRNCAKSRCQSAVQSAGLTVDAYVLAAGRG